jgi:hypothetical protein
VADGKPVFIDGFVKHLQSCASATAGPTNAGLPSDQLDERSSVTGCFSPLVSAPRSSSVASEDWASSWR